MRQTETALPSSIAGLNRQDLTVASQAALSSAGPRTAFATVTLPSAPTAYFTITVPSMPAAFAAAGYAGAGCERLTGGVTFSVTRIGPVGLAFGGGGGGAGGTTGSAGLARGGPLPPPPARA